MRAEQRKELSRLEGRTVSLALADGSRLDEVSLVSAGRATLWVFTNGEDRFIPVAQVIDVWEGPTLSHAA